MGQLLNGKEYLDLTKPRPVYNPGKRDLTVRPTDEVRQKLAKTRNWAVCTSWNDIDNKRFVYRCAVGNDFAERSITFDEVCEEFHWKSFKLLNNEQTVKFVDDPSWEEEIVKIGKRIERAQKKAAKIAEAEAEQPND